MYYNILGGPPAEGGTGACSPWPLRAWYLFLIMVFVFFDSHHFFGYYGVSCEPAPHPFQQTFTHQWFFRCFPSVLYRHVANFEKPSNRTVFYHLRCLTLTVTGTVTGTGNGYGYGYGNGYGYRCH